MEEVELERGDNGNPLDVSATPRNVFESARRISRKDSRISISHSPRQRQQQQQLKRRRVRTIESTSTKHENEAQTETKERRGRRAKKLRAELKLKHSSSCFGWLKDHKPRHTLYRVSGPLACWPRTRNAAQVENEKRE